MIQEDYETPRVVDTSSSDTRGSEEGPWSGPSRGMGGAEGIVSKKQTSSSGGALGPIDSKGGAEGPSTGSIPTMSTSNDVG